MREHRVPRRASKDGNKLRRTRPSFETPRKRAAPQDDGFVCGCEGLPKLEARSAIAFITAFLTPGSYSEWPAPSTIRTSAFGHAAASACEVEDGHRKS